MAAPGKSSRWGSFLSQAVAGVESRLDNILAEADEAQSSASHAAPTTTKPSPPANAQPSPLNKPSPLNSRSSSANRTNDRLQARLAKAVAAKNIQGVLEAKPIASPRSSMDHASRGSLEQQRTSSDGNREPDTATPSAETKHAKAPYAPPPTEQINEVEIGESTVQSMAKQSISNDSTALDVQQHAGAGTPSPRQEPLEVDIHTLAGSLEIAEQQADVSDLARDVEELRSKQQDEIQEYIERIDSLQAKIQYLSKSAAESSKKAASSAPSGSVERKLAEKDEKIALLMEEGQKLSSAEQKYRTTIKKLRIQAAESENQAIDLRKDKEKALLDSEALRDRLKGTDEKEKQQDELRKTKIILQKNVDSLKADNSKKVDTIRLLEKELKSKNDEADSVNVEALKRALDAEQEKQREIEDANATLRAEVEALTHKAHQDTVEWNEKLSRSVERGRSVESDLRVELRTVESKLEAIRATAEEASSGAVGEAQVKLFRQIETLQSQYASASDNWQSIEASLLAKASNLENERDEAQKRESDMRKKARDAASRCRSLEDELHTIEIALVAAQEELKESHNQLVAVRASAKATEMALDQARGDLEKEHNSERQDQDHTADSEPRQWAEDVAGATSKFPSGPDSPLLSVQRTFSSDIIGISGSRPRRVPTPGSISDSLAEGSPFGRRLSSQPPLRASASSTAGSGPPPAPFSPFEPPNAFSHDPPPSTTERENDVDDTAPSSPRNMAHDMISVSTVAAGPSVQLMERMSAAIRRLEAEKVASREEMARISSQRDEARTDMVSLMKDLEDAKTASTRVPQLEEEVSSLNARYQTTLEMLGEKSELVEELKADVDDVKAMYRELVERTVK